jgi:hypothetical protein
MLEKYKPTKFSEIIGNKTAVQTLGRWLLTWPAISSCVLVSGPCGVGKTLSIELLTKQPEYNVMEVNSDDERNDGFIQSRVAPFVKTKKNIWGKSNILIVNDVDVSNDNGFLGALCGCLKETKIPIILTCNDRYEPKIKTLASLCTDIKFFKPTSQEICRYITEIVKKELNTTRLTTYQNQLIQTSVETAEGDVRNAILNTEFAMIYELTEPTTTTAASSSYNTKKKGKIDNKKDKIKKNIFELTTDLMSQMTDFVDKVDLFNMEKELLPLMIHENYPQNIIKTKTKQEELFHLNFASCGMSDYDVLPYEYNSVAVLTVTTVCHPKSKINFTGYLGKMSSRTKKSNVLKTIESNVQLPVGHFRLDYMSYMLMILYNEINSPKAFVDKCVSYGFTKEDIQDNLSVILITEGVYARCDYSVVDKKVKASLTKMFSLKQSTEALPDKAISKSVTKKKNKEEKDKKEPKESKQKATKKSTTTTEPVLQVENIPVIKEEQKQEEPTAAPKTISTIFRRKSQKVTPKEESLSIDISTPSSTPVTESLPVEKTTKTIVRKRASKQTT